MYYILIVIALTGNNITTIQTPLQTSKLSVCEEVGADGVKTLSKTANKATFVCMEVKK